MITARFFFVLCAMYCCACPAQTSNQSGETKRLPSSIPDPDDKLSLVILAANPSVAKELGLTAEQFDSLRKAVRESNGNLNGQLVFQGEKIPTQEERMAMYREIRQRNESLVDELLSPPDWVRLRELAFQVEVSRLGFGEALVNGRLGAEVGVFENQKTHLMNAASKIEAKAAAEIAAILARAQKEMLNELSADQRIKAEKCLGKPFFFKDDEFRAFTKTRF